MGQRPALALLLAYFALSLFNTLVKRSVPRTKMTAAHGPFMVLRSTAAWMISTAPRSGV